MSEDGDKSREEKDPLTPARLRAMAEWFREFAAMGSVEQRLWQLDLAATYERLANEHELLQSRSKKLLSRRNRM